MAITNQERVQKGLDLLKDGLRSFVEQEMKATHGEKWQKVADQPQRCWQPVVNPAERVEPRL